MEKNEKNPGIGARDTSLAANEKTELSRALTGGLGLRVGAAQKIPRKQNLPAWVVKPFGAELCPISELSDDELYKKCRECGQSAKMWSRKFAALLPEVAKRGLHRKKGFVSLHTFAAMVAGMSEYAVDKILHLHAKIKDKPCLLKLFESGAEGWSKIEKVAYVSTPVTDRLWAEKVTLLSTGALESLVQNYRSKLTHMSDTQSKTLFSQDSGESGSPLLEPPVRFSFPASREVEFDLRLAKQRLEKLSKQPLSWNETFQMIIEKSDLSKSGKNRKTDSQPGINEEMCTKCSRKKAILKICEECSKMLGEGKND